MNQLELLFNKLALKRSNSYELLNDDDAFEGVWESIIDKYSHSAHFILELLQNADDCKAKSICFDLFEDRLIFKHNGTVRFNISDPDNSKEDKIKGLLGHINSITAIGNSTKKFGDKSKINTIGKFGVGFKSVFQYCNETEIYDNPFSFKIKNFIVPELIDYKETNKQETKFVFFFKKDGNFVEIFNEIKNKLIGLPENILFLNHIEEIDWNDNVNKDKGQYLKSIESKNNLNFLYVISKTEIENEAKEETNEYLKFSKNVDNHLISILFKTFDSKISYRATPYIYCFFPLIGEGKPFNFYIHAPFLLTDNRQNINTNSAFTKWNNNMINGISDLLCESVLKLRNNKFLDYQGFNALPISELNENDNFYPIYAKFVELVKNEKVIPSINEGEFLNKDNSFIPETKDISKLFKSNDLDFLFNKKRVNWIDERITETAEHSRNLWRFLRNVIGVDFITHARIINNFNESILKDKSDDWFYEFYSYLDYRVKEFKEKIKKLKIIKLEDNSITEAFDGFGKPNCFLQSALKIEIPLVKKCFVERDSTKNFFKNIDIVEYNLEEYLEYTIIPKYRLPLNTINPKYILEDHRVIINVLNKVDHKKRNELIFKLKLIYIMIGYDSGKKKYISFKPESLYLGSKFTENSEIESFFNNLKILDEIFFIHDMFYDVYKNNLKLLNELGCKSQLNIKKELENRILEKYKYPSNEILNDIDEHLRDIEAILSNFKEFNFQIPKFFEYENRINGKYTGIQKEYILFSDWNNEFREIDHIIKPDSSLDKLFDRLPLNIKDRLNYAPLNSIYKDLYVQYLNLFNTFNLKIHLVIEEIKVSNYPLSKNYYLKEKSPTTYKSDPVINKDYHILELESMLKLKDMIIMLEIWLCVSKADKFTHIAIYQHNKKTDQKTSLSTYMKILKESEWIPTKSGKFKKPFDCSKDELLEGFPYNDTNGWLTLVEFGKGAERKSLEVIEKEKILESMNISIDAVNVLQDLSPQEQLDAANQFVLRKKELEYKAYIKEITDPIENADKRKLAIQEKVKNAQTRLSKNAERSISITKPVLNPLNYLENFYKKRSSCFCQICLNYMPFKYENSDYKETVRMFDKDNVISTELEESFVLLCPVCAAKYQLLKKSDEFVNKFLYNILQPKPEHFNSVLVEINLPKIKDINPFPTSIYFHPKHLFDIQLILDAEDKHKIESKN